MSTFDRVSWREGVYLLPQHFQQLERSLLAQGAHARAHRRERGFGLIALELDTEGIAEGHLALRRLVALLPSGEVLDMPRVDPLPPPRTLTLRGDVKGLQISIALPRIRPGHTYASDDLNRRDVPFLESEHEVTDLYDGDRRRTLLLYRKNPHLLIGGEDLDGAESLPIAEIIRGDDGRPTLSPGYIPPLMVAAGSPAFRGRMRQLVGALRSRVTGLAEERRRRVDQLLEMTPGDIQGFLFLQTLSSHLPALEHLSEDPDAHPAAVYGELLRLYGALLPFHPRETEPPPAYDHREIGPVFGALDETLRRLMRTQVEARYQVYPFKQDGEYHVATLSDPALLASGSFILAATANVAVDEIQRQLPGLLKMSDRERIGRLVRGAVRGIEISPLSRPPTGLPVPEEAAFFRVRTSGEHWEAVARAGEAVAAASAVILPGLTLRLIAAKSEGGRR